MSAKAAETIEAKEKTPAVETTAASDKRAKSNPAPRTVNKSDPSHFYRYAEVDENSVDDEKRTLQIVFATENPVKHTANEWDIKNGIAREGETYLEVLSHDEGDADFSALNNGGALLDEHNPRIQIGTVRHAEVSADKKSRAAIEYDGVTQLSLTRFKQAKTLSRRHFSVGGNKTEYIGEAKLPTGETVKRFKWEAYEISSVATPADGDASVGRAAEIFHCTRCAQQFERSKLDDDFRCADCGSVSRSLRKMNFQRDAADRISISEIAQKVCEAVEGDARFRGMDNAGNQTGWCSVRELYYDEDIEQWSAVIYCSTDSKTYEVDFIIVGGEIELGEESEVEPKVNYEVIDDDMDRTKAVVLLTRSSEKPYGNVTYADPGYQKDGKKRYPINTKEHARSAWNYINKEKNADKYSASDLAKVKSKIRAACKKFGVEISDTTRSAVDSTKLPEADKSAPNNLPKPIMAKSVAELKTEAPELVAELDRSIRAEESAKVTGEVRTKTKTDLLARNKKITDKTDALIKDHGMKLRGRLGETLRGIANEFLTRDHGDAADAQVLAEFGQRALEEIAKVQPEPYLMRSKVSTNEYEQYSMLRGIQNCIKNEIRVPKDGIEREIHDDMIARAKEFGGLLGGAADAGGFHVPMDAPSPRYSARLDKKGRIQRSRMVGEKFQRDLYTADFGSGGSLVPTELLVPIIEPLRNWTALDKVNVRFLGGLSGNIVIPRQTGVTAPQAVSEIGALAASQPDFDQISAKPRRIGNQTKYSKQLIFQSSPDVEALIRDDNFKQIALLVDEYGINGSGAGSQPLGVMNQPGVFAQIFGGTPSIALIEAMATKIRAANIREPLAFLTTSNTRGRWRSIAAGLVNSTTVISGQQNAIWTGSDDEGDVTGRPAFDSQQIPNDQVILGAWDNLIWFQWAGVEVVVDPYTAAGTGEWVITMNTYNDFAVRHPQAFCVSGDSGNQ